MTLNVPGNSDVALDDLELVVLCDELHVERALDVQSLGDLLRDLLDLSQSFLIQVLWRGHESGISYKRMSLTMMNLQLLKQTLRTNICTSINDTPECTPAFSTCSDTAMQ